MGRFDASKVIENIIRHSNINELSESEYEQMDDTYNNGDATGQTKTADNGASFSPAAAVADNEWERNDDADDYVPIWCPSYSRICVPVLPESLRPETIDYFYSQMSALNYSVK